MLRIFNFQMSRHLEMPPEVPLLPFTLKCLPFTLKCLPFALKSSCTSTYEITCIHVYTQLKHVWVCMRAASIYVCASVYMYICMEVYMYVRVFIGVYCYVLGRI